MNEYRKIHEKAEQLAKRQLYTESFFGKTDIPRGEYDPAYLVKHVLPLDGRKTVQWSEVRDILRNAWIEHELPKRTDQIINRMLENAGEDVKSSTNGRY